MTDRLDEIRARAEAATPGPWRELDAAYGMIVHDTGPDSAQIIVLADSRFGGPDSTFIAHAREDIPYLLAEIERLRDAAERAFGNVNARNETLEAEVERLRDALDTEKEANATKWRKLRAKTVEIEQLADALADAHEECDRLMDLYLAQRREHNKAAAEVERLRAALEGKS